MTLEENVLAYLDGSLGEAESAELLHTLSASPDKRAVLEEHLRLSGMLKLGSKPFAVPAAAERELATRLPFLAETPRTVPFYAKPMLLLTSAAATLAVVGGLWWNASRDSALGHSNPPVAFREQGTASDPAANANYSTDIPASTGNRAATSSAKQGALGANARVADAPLENARNAGSHRSGSNLLNREQAVRNTSTSQSADRSAEAGLVARNGADLLQSNSSNEPTPTISAVGLKAEAIRIPSVATPRTLHEIAFGVPDRLRPLSIGASAMASGYYFPSLEGIAKSSPTLGMDPQLTVTYDVTQWFAFGVEAGYTQFGKVTNNFEFAPSFDGTEYSQVSYKTGVAGASTGYLRAALHFTLDPAAEYPIRIGAAGGYAFEGTAAPCAALSAGITRTLADDLSLDLDMVLSGLWSTQMDQSGPSIVGVTGIKYNSAQSQAPFTSAFGLRAGIRYRP